MPAYDAARFSPPAPVCAIDVVSSDEHNSISGVHMLIDTGADVTLLPRGPIESLLTAASKLGSYDLESF